MNTITKLAGVFIVLGAVLLAGPVFGFETIAADRETSVSTADPSDALIGITEQSSTVDHKNKETEIASIKSNTNAIDITTLDSTDIVVSDSSDLLDTGTELQNGNWAVTATCAGNNAGGKTETTVLVTEVVGDGITVSGASSTFDVSVTCGDGDLTADWYEYVEEYTGNSKTVQFTIKNTANESVTVSGIKIEDTKNNGAESYDSITIQETTNEEGYSVGDKESHDPVTIESGEQAEYTIGRFDKKVKGSDVVITILTEGEQ